MQQNTHNNYQLSIIGASLLTGTCAHEALKRVLIMATAGMCLDSDYVDRMCWFPLSTSLVWFHISIHLGRTTYQTFIHDQSYIASYVICSTVYL